MKTNIDYLYEEIPKFKQQFEDCDKYEKIHFKTLLKKYEWQFENQKEFLKWYLAIVL